MKRYAEGRKAWGHCGRCGLRFYLRELRFDGQVPSLQVCSQCWDPEHPQERLPDLIDPVLLWMPTGDRDGSLAPSACAQPTVPWATLSAAAPAGTTTVILSASQNLPAGTPAWITLEDASVFRTHLSGPLDGNTVAHLAAPLPAPAEVGAGAFFGCGDRLSAGWDPPEINVVVANPGIFATANLIPTGGQGPFSFEYEMQGQPGFVSLGDLGEGEISLSLNTLGSGEYTFVVNGVVADPSRQATADLPVTLIVEPQYVEAVDSSVEIESGDLTQTLFDLSTTLYPIEFIDEMESAVTEPLEVFHPVTAEALDSGASIVSGLLRDPLVIYDDAEDEAVDSSVVVVSGEIRAGLITYNNWPAEALDSSATIVSGSLT